MNGLRILIRSAEVMKTSEQMRGVKLTELESRLATLRAIHFLQLLVSFAMAAYAVSSGAPWGIFAFPCMAVFNLLIVYLVSVDRPPFARSRAWESFKEFFKVFHGARTCARTRAAPFITRAVFISTDFEHPIRQFARIGEWGNKKPEEPCCGLVPRG